MEAQLLKVIVVVPQYSLCLCCHVPAVECWQVYHLMTVFTATVTRWQHMLSATWFIPIEERWTWHSVDMNFPLMLYPVFCVSATLETFWGKINCL